MKTFFLAFFLVPIYIFSQNDTIWTKKNDLLIGEIKGLSKGVLTIETSFSDSDFKVDFDEVKVFSTQKVYVVFLTDNTRFTGKIIPTNTGKLQIVNNGDVIQELDIDTIIAIAEVNQQFWKRISGALDIGFNMTKSNNFRQLNISSLLKYSSDSWNFKFSSNTLYSSRDDNDRIERRDYNLTGLRFINKWYLESTVVYFSSTELGLKSRVTPGIGIGRGLVFSQNLYFLAGGGINYNIEKYFDETQNKNSTELKFITQLDLYNIKDFSLFTNVAMYPSLSEKGRFRLDYNLKLKYDLPLDFYIKAELNLNYDNQSVVEGNNSDYLFSSGIGWELD